MQLTESDIFQVIYGIVGGVLALLLFGNIYFIKKLVHKIDQIDPLTVTISSLSYKVDELCQKVGIIYDLRLEISAIKARFMQKHDDPGL